MHTCTYAYALPAADGVLSGLALLCAEEKAWQACNRFIYLSASSIIHVQCTGTLKPTCRPSVQHYSLPLCAFLSVSQPVNLKTTIKRRVRWNSRFKCRSPCIAEWSSHVQCAPWLTIKNLGIQTAKSGTYTNINYCILFTIFCYLPVLFFCLLDKRIFMKLLEVVGLPTYYFHCSMAVPGKYVEEL